LVRLVPDPAKVEIAEAGNGAKPEITEEQI
jgi:hypothetical protein